MHCQPHAYMATYLSFLIAVSSWDYTRQTALPDIKNVVLECD